MADKEEILAKKGPELFKEVLRVYPGACPEDYFANGAWRDDLMAIDWQLIQAHREESGAEDPPALEDIKVPELPKAWARAPVGPGDPLKPSPSPGSGAVRTSVASTPFKLWGSGGFKALGAAAIKPSIKTMRVTSAASPKASGSASPPNGGVRTGVTTTTTTIKTTMAARKPIFPSSPVAGRPGSSGPAAASSKPAMPTTSNTSTSTSSAPESTLAELKRIQLFVQKWKLSPIKTKLMLAKIGPNGRKYVLTYFQPKSGGDPTDELKVFIDQHQAKGSWAGVPTSAVRAPTTTTTTTTTTTPSNGGALGRATPSGAVKRPAPKTAGLLSMSAKAHAKPKPTAKASGPTRTMTPTTTTTTTTKTTTTIRASSLLQSSPPKAKAKAKLHARLLPPSQGARPQGPSASGNAPKASAGAPWRPKAAASTSSASSGVHRPKLSSGVHPPRAALARPSGPGGGKGAGPPARGSVSTMGGPAFRPTQGFRALGKSGPGPTSRSW